jgi:hypothetical protein
LNFRRPHQLLSTGLIPELITDSSKARAELTVLQNRRFAHQENAMESKYQLLQACGYQIVWASGSYCRACLDQRDVMLRWDGACWVMM